MKTATKYLIALFAVMLLVSVGFNIYDHFVVWPSTQATLNNKDVKAFESWLDLLVVTDYFLSNPKTNVDIHDAWLIARMASEVTEIFTPSLESFGGLARNLSFGVTYATSWLVEATDAVYVGNKTGVVSERELEQPILNIIANLTRVIRNLVHSTLQVSIIENGMSLAQQLQENNLLNPLANYCGEMMTIGQQIYEYYNR